MNCIVQDLGSQKSDNNLTKLTQLETVENEQQNEYADGIIKELLISRNNNVRFTHLKKVKELKPNAVCFNYSGSDLTHLEVKRAMDKLLVDYPGITMSTIEFQPRIKLLLRDEMDNTCRWVIHFHTESERYRMTNRELTIRGKPVLTKRYDEIVIMEQKQYGRMSEIKKITMNN